VDHISGLEAFELVFKPYNVINKMFSGDEIETNSCEDNARLTGRKRKHVDFR
jgi:hypothetical protein